MPASAAASARRVPTATIGQVIERLRDDFPDLTISKVRFLEAEGLVSPARLSSGYRAYSESDVARLRYVLTAQSQHFLPLKVIKENLAAMDRGEAPAVPLPDVHSVRVAPVEAPKRTTRAASRTYTRAELIDAAGIDEPMLATLIEYRLLEAKGTAPAYFDHNAVEIARAAGRLAQFGVEPRHLRGFRQAADREVALVEAVATPMLLARDTQVRARAHDVIRDIGVSALQLHTALVRSGVQDKFGR